MVVRYFVRWFLYGRFKRLRCFDQTKKSLQIPVHQYASLDFDLMYSRHIRIISCVGFEPFLLAINLDDVL